MAHFNLPRLFLGTLVAAIILFLTDGFIHETFAGADWTAVYDGLKTATPPPHRTSLIYFGVFELGRAFTAMMFYVLMRAPFGAGPKTAVLAAVVGWIAFSLTAPVQFIPLGFFSNELWLKVGAIQLVTSIVATLAGAALYKDAARTAVA